MIAATNGYIIAMIHNELLMCGGSSWGKTPSYPRDNIERWTRSPRSYERINSAPAAVAKTFQCLIPVFSFIFIILHP